MGGHGSHPLGWTVLALVVVAYAHVILELAAAGLALAITARITTATPWQMLLDRMMSRHDPRARRSRDASATQRSTFAVAAGDREADRSAKQD
jgi:hypothetical protein